MRAVVWMAVAVAAAVPAARAAEEKPQVKSGPPPARKPKAQRRTVATRVVPLAVSSKDGSLKDTRALSIAEGEARLLFEQRELTVRPGDRLGGDLVQRVEPGLIVLRREATENNSEATVVMKFDGEGLATVRVYWMQPPTEAEPNR